MTSSLKAFFAAACGALIGTLVGLELGGLISLVCGMLVGGIVGYVGYAPITACLTFKRILIEEMGTRLRDIGVVLLVLTYVAFAFLPFYCAAAFMAGVPLVSELSWGYNLGMGVVLVFGYGVVFGMVVKATDNLGLRYIPIIEWVYETLEEFMTTKGRADELLRLLLLNPVSVAAIVIPILIPLYVGVVVVAIVAGLAVFVFKALRLLLRIFFDRVLPKTLAAIHSEARLVAAIAAALGAAAGFFTGSVLAGAAIGGVLGLADIAFLRRRLLAWAASRAAA